MAHGTVPHCGSMLLANYAMIVWYRCVRLDCTVYTSTVYTVYRRSMVGCVLHPGGMVFFLLAHVSNACGAFALFSVGPVVEHRRLWFKAYNAVHKPSSQCTR